jgi:hypothetical protein
MTFHGAREIFFPRMEIKGFKLLKFCSEEELDTSLLNSLK